MLTNDIRFPCRRSLIEVTRLLILGSVGLGISSCKKQAEKPDSQLVSIHPKVKTISIKDLKTCNLGHSSLRDVPIVYGLGAGTAPYDFESLEEWPGGCIVGSETHKVVCTRCRSYYEPSTESWINVGENEWRTDSIEINDVDDNNEWMNMLFIDSDCGAEKPTETCPSEDKDAVIKSN